MQCVVSASLLLATQEQWLSSKPRPVLTLKISMDVQLHRHYKKLHKDEMAQNYYSCMTINWKNLAYRMRIFKKQRSLWNLARKTAKQIGYDIFFLASVPPPFAGGI